MDKFEINIDEIGRKFSFGKENGLQYTADTEYKIFPFVINEKNIFTEFDGVVGAFSRLICKKELKEKFDPERFIDDVASCIEEYEGIESEVVFKDTIRSMFIENNSLVDFDIKALNYKVSKSAEEKVAKFLYSLFFDERLESEIETHYERDVENILYKVILKGLPELVEKETEKEGYILYAKFIKDLFIDDLKFLMKNEVLYKKSIKRFLEYYYMFYISQILMKLNGFDSADLERVEPLYYTLNWEKVSENRTGYNYGFKKIKRLVNTALAHTTTLEMLNTNNLGEKLNYVELAEKFNEYDLKNIEEELEKILKKYIKQIDFDYSELKLKKWESKNVGFNKVFELYKHVEYQFLNGSRARANEAYRNWYLKFLQKNFGKIRGKLGYNLNFTEEDIILMTKICIKDLKKIKLSILFEEFRRRGMFFDRDSQKAIVKFYEKLNLLEKKSDSGDAQYVRSIL